MVRCQVCGKEFRAITPTHLRCHDVTMAQYRMLYPSADLRSKETAEKHLKSVRCFTQTDGFRQSCRERCLERLSDPEYAARWKKGMSDGVRRPETRSKIARASRKRWQNPEYYAMMVEKRREAWSRPERHEKRSKYMIKAWAAGVFDDADRSNVRRGESHHWWTGGSSLYPLEFNEGFKETIRERDGYRCAICWLFGCDVHHIDQDKQNTQPLNCITLCRSCHTFIHQHSDYDYWQVRLQQFVYIREDSEEERRWYAQTAL